MMNYLSNLDFIFLLNFIDISFADQLAALDGAPVTT
jgi:hypothetical protein